MRLREMKALFSKLKEPSTIRGVAILLGLAGINLDPEAVNAITAGVIAVIGLIEVFRKEK
jgi:hypothetical protein